MGWAQLSPCRNARGSAILKPAQSSPCAGGTAVEINSPAIQLANWVQQNYPFANLEPLTHLKLQKLAFYVYGAAMAFDQDHLLPGVRFEAWQHGPVCREIWLHYRDTGREALPEITSAPIALPESAATPMLDALAVYGLLRTWPLRQQSHLEHPWIASYSAEDRTIDPKQMREHFRRKFNSGAVAWPEYLVGAGSLRLDGVPVAPHPSLRSLADAVRTTARRLEQGRAEVR